MSKNITIEVSVAPFASTTTKTVYGHILSNLTEGDMRNLLVKVAKERQAIKDLDLGKVEKGSYQERELASLDAARVALIDALNAIEG